jgi:hypothetical protein
MLLKLNIWIWTRFRQMQDIILITSVSNHEVTNAWN